MALSKALIENRIDVLILDPFVKTHGVSENDNAAIDGVARKFNDIAEIADCSIELAHHVRKASNFGRAEVTADDGRGAGSLKDAARCVRVANRMTSDEATSMVDPCSFWEAPLTGLSCPSRHGCRLCGRDVGEAGPTVGVYRRWPRLSCQLRLPVSVKTGGSSKGRA
ncbi:MAG TPA: AAA family ATPase [Methylocella sp.]|nr:AAA family ATPase [Methylocella sp.]